MTKTCGLCGASKPLAEYYKRASRCKPCTKAVSKAWYWTHRDYARARAREYHTPERIRSNNLRKYGLTLETFADLLAAQDGACRACGDRPPAGRNLVVDHDHRTNQVRGLLCNQCNTALGLLKDDPARIQKLATYLAVVLYDEKGDSRDRELTGPQEV